MYLEGKSSLSSPRDLPGGTRLVDKDVLDLQEAFVDIRLPVDRSTTVVLRPGRQEFLFGAERLVSPLPWSNTMRTWDGVSSIITRHNFKTMVLYTNYVPVRQVTFNRNSGLALGGIYSTYKMYNILNVDLYWLYYNNAAQQFARANGKEIIAQEKINTLGLRLFGKLNNSEFTYDVEGALQIGTFGNQAVAAYMIASNFTRLLFKHILNPQLNFGFDYASGGNPTDPKINTFNQLFNSVHKYYGWMDYLSRQNAVDLNGGISIQPKESLTLGVNLYQFWLANSNDAYYNGNGVILRGSGKGRSNQLGREIDTYLKYKFNCHLSSFIGFSRFFPGLFIKQTGPSQLSNFGYLELTYMV